MHVEIMKYNGVGNLNQSAKYVQHILEVLARGLNRLWNK